MHVNRQGQAANAGQRTNWLQAGQALLSTVAILITVTLFIFSTSDSKTAKLATAEARIEALEERRREDKLAYTLAFDRLSRKIDATAAAAGLDPATLKKMLKALKEASENDPGIGQDPATP